MLPWQPLAVWLLLLAAEEQQKPLLFRLDGATRAMVLAALAALVILGFLMIALTWLGARMTRRYMGPSLKRSKPTTLPSDEEWARPSPDAAEPPTNQPPRKKKG